MGAGRTLRMANPEKLTAEAIDEIWDRDDAVGECLHRLQRASWGRPLDAAHAYVQCVVAPALLASPSATNQVVSTLGGAIDTFGKDSAAAAAWAVERLNNEASNPQSKLRAELLPQASDAFWRASGVAGCTVSKLLLLPHGMAHSSLISNLRTLSYPFLHPTTTQFDNPASSGASTRTGFAWLKSMCSPSMKISS